MADGVSPEQEALLKRMEQSQLQSLAVQQAMSELTMKYQNESNAIKAASEAQTAAFNAVNHNAEQMQAR